MIRNDFFGAGSKIVVSAALVWCIVLVALLGTCLYSLHDRLGDIDGDINGDGRVNAIDVTMMIRHVAGEQDLTGRQIDRGDLNNNGRIDEIDICMVRAIIMPPNGDANGDGCLTIADLMIAQRHLLGLVRMDDQAIQRCDMNTNGKIDIADKGEISGLIMAIHD